MALNRVSDLDDYIELPAAADRTRPAALYQDLLIHVTRFFREPESFDALGARGPPDAARTDAGRRRPVRIWVAGCSTGEEAYSLAIALLGGRRRAARPA